MRVTIRYEDAAAHVHEATLELTAEERLALSARDQAHQLGEAARQVLRDFGLEPGWTPTEAERPEVEARPSEEASGPPSVTGGASVDAWEEERAEILRRLEALEGWRRDWP